MSKTCVTCKYAPPMNKWPCEDCDMRKPADRWEPKSQANCPEAGGYRMRTAERDLCRDCMATLIASQLIYRRATDYDPPEEPRCAWCGRARSTKRVRIRYGRRDVA